MGEILLYENYKKYALKSSINKVILNNYGEVLYFRFTFI